MQLATEGKKLIDDAIELAEYARERINKIHGLYCFGEEVLEKEGAYGFDPTKITITSRELGLSGHDLEEILTEKYFIQPEMSDLYNVLCVFSFGDTKETVDKLLSALEEISAEECCKIIKKSEVLDIPSIPESVLTPRDAFNSLTISIPLEDSIGLISAEFLMAYPPGIPILCPGEIVTQEIVDYVKALKAAKLYVQGTEDPEVNRIKIVSDLQIMNSSI
jgi:lysine decarboxylase